MPANSKHSNILIWRVPGLPVQAWLLSEVQSDSDIKVTIGPFQGDHQTFHAEGPLTKEEGFQYINRNSLKPLDEVSSTTEEEHIERVAATVQKIKEENLRKVVIARREQILADFEVNELFNNLCEAYPKAVVYALLDDGKLWMGATPETLLTADEHAVYTMALAGTRLPDGPEFTEKEYDEQRAVTESIEQTLLELGSTKVVGKGPVPIQAGPVEHLITRIEASLPEFGKSADWARALHPTPAVSGFPKSEAMDIIREVEDFNRSLYAGYIGWESAENARYYVNLRCMEVGKNRINLYAGGGITALSDPKSEWNETVNKLKTLKAVIFPS